ncbi:MAG: hypothetical protein ACTSW1_00710 [Candidatus Hodarchaeales archaeon]
MVCLGIGLLCLGIGQAFGYFLPETDFLTVLTLLMIIVFGVVGLVTLTMGLRK